MKGQDYEQLTLFPVDSPVSRSLVPGSDEARTMTVTSGLRCLELYENSGPLGCLVRMCLGSSIWHSTRCFLTWKRKDMKSKRSLFQLAVSMPRTSETDVPFWPTPQLNGLACGRETLKRMVKKGLITEEFYRQVTAGNGGKINPDFLEWLMGYEQQFTKLIPTPTQTDYRGGCLSRYWRPSSQNGHVEREREQEGLRRSVEKPRMQSAWEDWLPEPELDRVVDGLPNRVDRIICLGNAVVPQQFYPFFKAIADIEQGEK